MRDQYRCRGAVSGHSRRGLAVLGETSVRVMATPHVLLHHPPV